MVFLQRLKPNKLINFMMEMDMGLKSVVNFNDNLRYSLVLYENKGISIIRCNLQGVKNCSP